MIDMKIQEDQESRRILTKMFKWFNPSVSSRSRKKYRIYPIFKQDAINLCSLGFGCNLGFSNSSTNSHSMTVTSKEPCTLLRVKRDAFQGIWSDGGSRPPSSCEASPSMKRKSLPSIPNRKSPDISQSNRHQLLHHRQSLNDSLDQQINNSYTNFPAPSPTPSTYDHSLSPYLQEHQTFQQLKAGRQSLPLISPPTPSSFSRYDRRYSCQCICSSTSPSSLKVIKDLKEPSTQLLRIGWVLRTCLLIDAPHLIKARRLSRGDSLSSTPTTYSPNPSSPNGGPSSFPASTGINHLSNRKSPSIVGSDLVDWLLSSSAQTPVRIHSRSQATSMFQVLFEDRVILKEEEVCDDDKRKGGCPCPCLEPEVQFKMDDGKCPGCSCSSCRARIFEDKYILYKFWFDCEGREAHYPLTGQDRRIAEREFAHSLAILCQMAPDAHLRTILRKLPVDRTEDDISLIFDELIQIPALAELTSSVKQELAHVISYEFHPKMGTVVFNQGDVGSWWYVIFRGSVHVNIAGKGTVCTLKEGEEFGKLALVNNAPRAATIITAEENTQFFKVPKEDFHRILVDVEANTIRLKEGGMDVLILLRLAVKSQSSVGQESSSPFSSLNSSGGSQSSKLVVIAGTPEKMIEYCLESKFDQAWSPAEYQFSNYYYYNNNNNQGQINGRKCPSSASGATSLYSAHLDLLSKDTFFEDFILTFLIFMTSSTVCQLLSKYYLMENYDTTTINDVDFFLRSKTRVVRFLYSWKSISGDHFLSDSAVISFIKSLENVIRDEHTNSSSPFYNRMTAEFEMIKAMSKDVDHFEKEYSCRGVKKWKSDLPGVLQIMTIDGSSTSVGLVGSFRELPSSSSSSSGQSSRSTSGFLSTLTAASSVIPGMNLSSSSDSQPTTINNMSTSSGFMSLNLSNNILGSAFLGASNNMASPLASALPSCPTFTPDYIHDPYYQDPIRPKDEIITRVYYADHTYTTLKYSMATSALKIKEVAAEKLSIKEPLDKLLLVEVKSSGERAIFADKEISIGTGLSVNGRIFVSLRDHLDALVPLAEQEGTRTSTYNTIDDFSGLDLAYHLTHYAWVLFNNVHERELIFQVFGREKFNRITSNLDLFLRHFEEVQYWVTTEIVLCNSVSKRVNLLRKFIKTAQVCKEYQNLHTFFAIVLGLSNIAVSRLTSTWERLPSKVKRVYKQFETLIDPSRNQRLYRVYLSTLEPPVIPFTPLLLKDMTFANEGNRTYVDKHLVNFEKMQMLAQAMRTFRYCKSKPLSSIEGSVIASNASSSMPLNRKIHKKIDFYIKNIRVIDSQKILTKLSHSIEPNNKSKG